MDNPKKQKVENKINSTTMKLAAKVSTPLNAKHAATWWTALFSVVVYGYSVLSLTSWWFFLVPNTLLFESLAGLKLYSMDTASATDSTVAALTQNFAAIFVFGFTHSLFARRSVKEWMGLPVSVERSFYCLQGAFFLHMLQKYCVEVDINTMAVWDVSAYSALCKACLGIFWLGAAILLSATFALDHFHLFGLSQGFGVDLNKKFGLAPQTQNSGLVSRWHYRLVAHPIMTGALTNCWATPVMTPSRLFFALFMTAYVVSSVTKLEEPALKKEMGKPYIEYLTNAPRFFPSPPFGLKISMAKNKPE